MNLEVRTECFKQGQTSSESLSDAQRAVVEEGKQNRLIRRVTTHSIEK
jgi:hypothetical protein